VTELTRFSLASGGTVIVESEDTSRVVSAGKTEPKPRDAHESLKRSLASVTEAASEVLDSFRSMMRRPDEVEIEFGVTLDARFGALIASSSAGAHLTVSLRWSGSQDPGPGGSPDHEKPE
jgi:hypothetical protein